MQVLSQSNKEQVARKLVREAKTFQIWFDKFKETKELRKHLSIAFIWLDTINWLINGLIHMLKSVRDNVKLIRKWGHRYITVAFMDTFIFSLPV